MNSDFFDKVKQKSLENERKKLEAKKKSVESRRINKLLKIQEWRDSLIRQLNYNPNILLETEKYAEEIEELIVSIIDNSSNYSSKKSISSEDMSNYSHLWGISTQNKSSYEVIEDVLVITLNYSVDGDGVGCPSLLWDYLSYILSQKGILIEIERIPRKVELTDRGHVYDEYTVVDSIVKIYCIGEIFFKAKTINTDDELRRIKK